MRKILARLLIMTMMLTLCVGTSYATTGAEPGTNITRVGIATGLYCNGTDDGGDSSFGQSKSSGANGDASSGQSEEQITTAAELNADSEHAVEALVQSYKAGKGVFEFSDESRFVIASGNKPTDEMVNTVQFMASQFAGMGLPAETALPVLYADEKYASDGDIVLSMVMEDDFEPGVDSADINEAYKLEIGKTAKLTACSTDGLYYGLITLMEIAAEKSDGDNVITMDRCTISDGPDVKERTLLLDCGRKYYSKEWIENLIKRCSLQRYNAIELHFSEEQCLRFDSVTFPWLTDGVDSLSREDMAEIIQMARTYHVDVIPSFDVPGHNAYIVKKYAAYVKANPDWSFVYGGKKYDSETEGFGSIANHYSYNGATEESNYIGIDVTKEHAVAFMNALIDDYADFFKMYGCTKINICGDELLGWNSYSLGGRNFYYDNRWGSIEHWTTYAQETLKIENGSASDTFVNYLNKVAKRLEKYGYTCRICNDDVNINDDQHVKLRKSIEIVMWSKTAANYSSITEAGHNIYINQENWTYYVVSPLKGKDIMESRYSNVNAENIYNRWNPVSFVTKSGYRRFPATDQMAGAYFDIWSDSPKYKNEATIWKETRMRTWANSCKMWNTEVSSSESGIKDALSYSSFKKFTEKLNDFPGYTGNPSQATQLPATSQLINGNSVLSRWFSE